MRSSSFSGIYDGKSDSTNIQKGDITHIKLCPKIPLNSVDQRDEYLIDPSKQYEGLMLPKGLGKSVHYGVISEVLKFPINSYHKKPRVTIKKEHVVYVSIDKIKNVLKAYHRGSSFQGTNLVESHKKKLERRNKKTSCDNINLEILDDSEIVITHDSKAEGEIRRNINESLKNKNINYSQRTIEVAKDAEVYENTSFENLGTEYFLLNCHGIASENAQELNEKIDNKVIEKKLKNIYKKMANSSLNNSKCSLNNSKRESEEILMDTENEDAIPKIVHNSALIASKYIWGTNEIIAWDPRFPPVRKIIIHIDIKFR